MLPIIALSTYLKTISRNQLGITEFSMKNYGVFYTQYSNYVPIPNIIYI